VLVLSAALLHASWNALVKSGGVPEFTIAAYQALGGLVCLILIFFVPKPDIASWPYLFASVVIHNFYYFTLARAYRLGDLSQVYPLFRGLAPILVALGAAVFAREFVSFGTVVGITFISVGLMSITLFSKHFGEISKPALMWGLITSVLIACYTVIDGIGVRSAGEPVSYIVWLFLFEPIPIVCWLLLRQRAEWVNYLKRSKLNILFGGVASSAAYGMVIFAMSLGAMAMVSSLRESSVIFAALIGSLFLKEPFGRRRVIASLFVALGIVVMRVW